MVVKVVHRKRRSCSSSQVGSPSRRLVRRSMLSRSAISRLPEEFRPALASAAKDILGKFPRTVALVVIGSLVEGGYGPGSDLDLVWIVRGPLRRSWWRELDLPHEKRTQVIPWLLKTAREHFQQATTLAHSVSRGIAVFDPERYAARLQALRLGLPDPGWMRRWYGHWLHFYRMGFEDDLPQARRWLRKYGREKTEVLETLARVAVNFAILLLETKGIVPTCKRQIRENFPQLTRGRRLQRAMELALRIHREDRWMSWQEAQEIVPLARWLKKQLDRALSPQVGEESHLRQPV